MKKGISLIVLVITIIVMIIIAGAIIISLNSTNIIEKANTAVDASNASELYSLVALTYMNQYVSYWEAKQSISTEDDAANQIPNAARVAADPTVAAMINELNNNTTGAVYSVVDVAGTNKVKVQVVVNGVTTQY